MASRNNVLTTFEPDRIIQPIYTGGDVALDRNARVLATCLGDEAVLTDLDSGQTLARLEGVGMISVTILAELADHHSGWGSSHRLSQSVLWEIRVDRMIYHFANRGCSHAIGIPSDIMFPLAVDAGVLSTTS